jgi:hypothetical protein
MIFQEYVGVPPDAVKDSLKGVRACAEVSEVVVTVKLGRRGTWLASCLEIVEQFPSNSPGKKRSKRHMTGIAALPLLAKCNSFEILGVLYPILHSPNLPPHA